MKEDKKDMAAIIIGRMKKPKASRDGEDPALVSACEDLLDSIKDGDPEAVASALRDAYDILCAASERSGGSGEDDEDDDESF